MKDFCRKIDGDLFGICDRLRAIDSGYFVCYNVLAHRFEAHNSHQKGSTLALVIPYDRLDVRTEILVRQTRVERRDELMRELEKQKISM